MAAANAAATPQVPDNLRDPAFDRYVDLLLLGRAWVNLDPALMADLGLQLAEGERVLLRSHKVIKSTEILQLAARMAADRRDLICWLGDLPDAVHDRRGRRGASRPSMRGAAS